ncbi:hypothetical protein GCM10012280_32060 [Wenjunlia tyrosinilytica]|uniref:Uncharacterized protein n=1 Tax=Wenjunlia tyrosinilytica TaxID=1544741 RepID=A0A917ZR46_9ACTN|nr:hypothetical protein GCM10012280_32060 [Wenjunlia tyrosinilytica]
MSGTHAKPTRYPGQPHQVTGNDPDLMGKNRARMVTRQTCQRRHPQGRRRTLVCGTPTGSPAER